jgi:hypothetical protein
MPADRSRREPQRLCHLRVRHPLPDELEDLALARRQRQRGNFAFRGDVESCERLPQPAPFVCQAVEPRKPRTEGIKDLAIAFAEVGPVPAGEDKDLGMRLGRLQPRR